ncbi:hypothetical protein BJX64DRAFT_288195 [Aspergillus heterothallicus]
MLEIGQNWLPKVTFRERKIKVLDQEISACGTQSLMLQTDRVSLGDFAVDDPRTLTIGAYRAYDWFGDGSLYILDTAGHTYGHLCALARMTTAAAAESETGTPPTFIFMGGDIGHHGALFRPTRYAPIPERIVPAPDEPLTDQRGCPGELYASMHRVRNESGGRRESYTTPLCVIPPGYV